MREKKRKKGKREGEGLHVALGNGGDKVGDIIFSHPTVA
jgi:hypothetical protein